MNRTGMDNTAITTGLSYLAAADPDLQQALALYGAPPPRIRPAGFETLLGIIVSQQLSTEVARTIMARLNTLLPQMTPEALLVQTADQLRAAGLSYRKVEYAQGLAQAICDGSFLPDSLALMDSNEAINAITALRGFGRWSAEIYLMFALQQTDVFPADDLALQVALGRLKGLPERPSAREARDLTQHWAPWRSVGSLFLWHYYRGAPDSSGISL